MALEFDWIRNWPSERGTGNIILEREPNCITAVTETPKSSAYACANTRWYALSIRGTKEELDALDEEAVKDLVRMYYNGRKQNET